MTQIKWKNTEACTLLSWWTSWMWASKCAPWQSSQQEHRLCKQGSASRSRQMWSLPSSQHWWHTSGACVTARTRKCGCNGGCPAKGQEDIQGILSTRECWGLFCLEKRTPRETLLMCIDTWGRKYRWQGQTLLSGAWSQEKRQRAQTKTQQTSTCRGSCLLPKHCPTWQHHCGFDTGENISISLQNISLGLETEMTKFPFTLLRHPGQEVEFTSKASATAESEREYQKMHLAADSSPTKDHYKGMQSLWQGCRESVWDWGTFVTTAGWRSWAGIYRRKRNYDLTEWYLFQRDWGRKRNDKTT